MRSQKTILFVLAAALLGLLLGYFIFRPAGDDAISAEHSHEEGEARMWTCSMHPQIMQPEPGDCPICGMDLIPAEAGAEGLAPDQFRLSENALALANVVSRPVGDGSEDSELMLSGKIRENEEANAVQASYFKGRIESLRVATTGERVQKGQVLATVYSPELVAAQQELLTAARIRDKQPRLYQAVREKLKRWKISESQINRIEAEGKVQQNFPILATVSGTVTEKLVQEGDYVQEGQPLFRIANLGSVWAVFDAYEQDLPYLEEGQQVNISVNALPSTPLAGRISFIEPVLNNATRTVKVRVPLTNDAGKLKPGMFVKGAVAIEGKAQTSLRVPASAVMWTGERSLVYVQPDPSQPVFEMREVQVGPVQQGTRAVLAGLEPGEHVVVNGTFTVDAAAQLQDKPSMMNRKDAGTPAAKGDISGAQAEALQASLPPYLKLKDALVADDTSAASQAAEQAYEALSATAGGDAWDGILKMLEAIVNNKEIENQRDHFVLLNERLIPYYQGAATSFRQKLYIQRCPMANQDQGANWISLEEEVRNPYFGDMMLRCGSVIDSINP